MTALAKVEHISVWKHGEVPEELNYGTSNRCGDIIVAPDLGCQFASSPKNKVGAHGYSPKEKDMQVTFIASGPSFPLKINWSHLSEVGECGIAVRWAYNRLTPRVRYCGVTE